MSVYRLDKDNILLVKHLGQYTPWSTHKSAGGTSANYDSYSKDILNFKDNHAVAIKKFTNLICPMLLNDFAICVVPSHNPNKTTGSLYSLAAAISDNIGCLNASNCLVRHTKIDKLANGGARATSIHLNSIRVNNKILIKNKKILLIDDVITSGNSMLACKTLLLQADAQKVWCLSLARTL